MERLGARDFPSVILAERRLILIGEVAIKNPRNAKNQEFSYFLQAPHLCVCRRLLHKLQPNRNQNKPSSPSFQSWNRGVIDETVDLAITNIQSSSGIESTRGNKAWITHG